ncbi:glycosyltransferase [Pontibacter virosus]|uniref:Glycosyl transferase family 1 n=1 Tax=Pontibacter virosus TaxID=1765052 RepID=A0A2U1AQH5_9BACT|nr:glycosyltransferase [Pontibacter virosus]PVY38679.1 glycosyl transferase family 1 [Pontibacter virosus]
MIAKPKLIYFQWDHSCLPKFIQLHMQLHVKCLSEFFEVVLINKDCNFKKVCDLYEPDLVLFESGFRSKLSRKLLVKETSSYTEIPRLGLHNGDSWCDCRVGFISDMEHWGIETFFTICTTTAEHTPSIADNLFVWPNFIDSHIFKDYGVEKNTPILYTGTINPLYPWRQKIHDITVNRFPSVVHQHTGYNRQSALMIYGEKYARSINTSWFVPACGSVAKEVVRKHFEIPGAKSCLLTEKSSSLEAAGFVDMQNCVFVDETDVLDKLNYLFSNTDVLKRITAAGYELVHSNHTFKQRNQILQWYHLAKNLKSDEKIKQNNPFGNLSLVKTSSNTNRKYTTGNGVHLKLIYEGDRYLAKKNYNEAEAKYLECLKYIFWMCEPKLKLAICFLNKGEELEALKWLIALNKQNLGTYSRAFSPDPIEWAYLIKAFLCNGKVDEALIRSKQFHTISHPELNRTRLILNYLTKTKINKSDTNNYKNVKHNNSIHQLPHLDITNWLKDFHSIFIACHQLDLAEKIYELIRMDIVDEEELSRIIVYPKSGLKIAILNIRVTVIQKLNSFSNRYYYKHLYWYFLYKLPYKYFLQQYSNLINVKKQIIHLLKPSK